MADPVTEPVLEAGWYRLTDLGWERVPDAEALAEITAMTPGYQDLVHVTVDAAADVPLF